MPDRGMRNAPIKPWKIWGTRCLRASREARGVRGTTTRYGVGISLMQTRSFGSMIDE